jgi:glycosyltransferase involved in cell wall biosynthesis
MGWLILLLLGAFAGLFVQLAEPLSQSIEVTPGVIVTAAGVVILVLICMQLSISISGLQSQVRHLAEDAALSQITPPPNRLPNAALVIIPALNEEATVANVVREVLVQGNRALVIDDGSTDNTSALAREHGAWVIRMPFTTGVGGALRAGLQFAKAHNFDIVVQCDADGQHPVAYLPHLIHSLVTRDCHMVIGSRFTDGPPQKMHIPRIRRVVMWILGVSASRAVGSNLTDVTSGFRAIRGELVAALADNMPSYYLGDTYEAVIAAGRAGYRIEEIAVPIGERLNGSSTANPVQAAKLTAKALITSAFHLHVRLPTPIAKNRYMEQ